MSSWEQWPQAIKPTHAQEAINRWVEEAPTRKKVMHVIDRLKGRELTEFTVTSYGDGKMTLQVLQPNLWTTFKSIDPKGRTLTQKEINDKWAYHGY